MTTYTASCDGTLGATVTNGDAGLGGLVVGGGGTRKYVAKRSGMTGTGNAIEFAATSSRANITGPQTTWAHGYFTFEFAIDQPFTGAIGGLFYAAVGATRVGQAYISLANTFLKIDGSTGQSEPQDASTHQFAGGIVYTLWGHIDRVAGTWRAVIKSSTYYEVLTGLCGATTGTLDGTFGIAGTTTTGKVVIKNLVWSSSSIAEPTQPLIITEPQVGNPSTTGFDVVVETASTVTHVRATVEQDGNAQYTTTAQAVTAHHWERISCGSLTQWTDYTGQVQVSTAGSGGPWVDAGQPFAIRTALPPDYSDDVVIKIAAIACEEDNRGSDTRTYDHIENVAKVHYTTTVGDQEYSNYQGLIQSKWRNLTSQKLQSCPGMARIYRIFGRLRRQRSDHDGGDGNGGFAQPAIEFAMAALEQTTAQLPTTTLTGGPMKTKGQVASWIIAGFQLIWLDARTMSRSDPTMADGPTKKAYHSDQVTWVTNLIQDFAVAQPDGINVVFTEWPWVGEAVDQGVVGIDDEIKWDHMARYKTQRTPLDAVFAAHPVLLVSHDYHGGVAVTDVTKHPIGHQTIAGGGTTNDSGNVRTPDLHNYDELFASALDTPDGIDINLYTLVTLRISGGVRSVTANMVNAQNGETVLSVGIPAVTDFLRDEPPVVTIDGAVLHGTDPYLPGLPNSRWWIERGAELGEVPANVVGAAEVRGVDGDGFESDDIDAEAGDIVLPMKLAGTDWANLQANKQALAAVFGRRKLRSLELARRAGESPTWRAMVRRDSSLVMREVDLGSGFARARADPVLHVPTGKWRGVVETTWAKETGTSGFGYTVVESIRAQSPIPDGWARMTGPFDTLRLTDGRSLNGFRWGIPGKPAPSAALGEYVIFDLAGWNAWLVDHDTWDPTEGGVLHVAGFEHFGSGASLLTLTGDMADSDPFNFTVRLACSCSDGVAGITKVELRVYDATHLPTF